LSSVIKIHPLKHDAHKGEHQASEARLNSTVLIAFLFRQEIRAKKLQSRDAAKYREIEDMQEPLAHPLFDIIEGNKEAWEIV
jgi:hypothetical protein